MPYGYNNALLGALNGMEFSTTDQDHDPDPDNNNADIYGGGFWHDEYTGDTCTLTGARVSSGFHFRCDALPDSVYRPILKTVQMWLMCKSQ